MAASYAVTAPLIAVTDANGASAYLYRGATLPEGTDTEQIKRLKADGLIGVVVAPVVVVPEPAEDSKMPAKDPKGDGPKDEKPV